MKISWFTAARIVIHLRNISGHLKRSADAAEAQAEIIRRMWEVEHPRRANKPRKFEIGVLDQEEANRRWRGELREDQPVAVQEEEE